MDETTYNIVFDGRLVVGRHPADVEKQFAARFGESVAVTVFSSASTVLKREVSRADAMKIQKSLERMGLVINMVPVSLSAPVEIALTDDGGETTPSYLLPQGARSRSPTKLSGLIERGGEVEEKSPRHDTLSKSDIDAAFVGVFDLPKASRAYSVMLLPVAFLMMLLPLIYLCLSFLSAYSVFWLVTDGQEFLATWRNAGGEAIHVPLAFLVAAVVGMSLLTIFLIRPLVSNRYRGPHPVELDADKEPVLFYLVEKICSVVDAPIPAFIEVDTQVNASASLRGGVFSKDLGLTIGMPLFYGMNVQTLSGILAHEFGHFTQASGMRALSIVRRINLWFHRKVHEPDSLDEFIDELCDNRWLIPSLGGYLAKAGSYLCRLLLRLLAWVARIASLGLSRQMEFDADRYEIALTGSAQYKRTAEQLLVLSECRTEAINDVNEAYSNGRLGNSLAMLVSAIASQLPSTKRQEIVSRIAQVNASVYDTHPSDQARIKRALEVQCEPHFVQAKSATGLLSQPDHLSHLATLQWYRQAGLQVNFDDLVSVDEASDAVGAERRAFVLRERYHGGMEGYLEYPELTDDSVLQSMTDDQLRNTVRTGIEQFNKSKSRFERADQSLSGYLDSKHLFVQAVFWLEMGYPINAETFQLSTTESVAVKQKLTMVRAMEAKERSSLHTWATQHGARFSASLEIASRNDNHLKNEIFRLKNTFKAIASANQPKQSMIEEAMLLEVKIQALEDDPNREDINRAIKASCEKIQVLQNQIRQLLGDATDPLNNDIWLAGTMGDSDPVQAKLNPASVVTMAQQTLDLLSHRMYWIDARMVEIAEPVESALKPA